jgi:hypothetical protein
LSHSTEHGNRDPQILWRLASGTEADLRGLQIKFTYVGVQTKTAPSLAFTTFHHLLQTSWFTVLRTSGVHYDGADHVLWNFTITPEEMKRVAAALTRLDSLDTQELQQPQLSLTLALRESRLGEAGYEAILGRDNAMAVIGAVKEALDHDNASGRKLIAEHQKLIFG